MPSDMNRTMPPRMWMPKNVTGSLLRLPFIQQLKRFPCPGMSLMTFLYDKNTTHTQKNLYRISSAKQKNRICWCPNNIGPH